MRFTKTNIKSWLNRLLMKPTEQSEGSYAHLGSKDRCMNIWAGDRPSLGAP